MSKKVESGIVKVDSGNHGVPTPIYFEGVLTDGGGANEFISATSRGRSRN